MDQGFFCRILGVDGVPQNGEVAARPPPLAAGRTAARNGLACVGHIDEWHLNALSWRTQAPAHVLHCDGFL
jgi:hypothetical protein